MFRSRAQLMKWFCVLVNAKTFLGNEKRIDNVEFDDEN